MDANTPMLNRDQGEPLPGLGSRIAEPAGVLRKNLKLQVYLGIAVLFIVATAVSSFRHKPAPLQQGQAVPPVQDANANIEEMRKNLEQQQRQDAVIRLPKEQSSAVPQPPTMDPSGANPGINCAPGQPCPNPPGYSPSQPQLAPERQAQPQLEQQERELAYKARFASNLAYSQSHGISSQSSLMPANQRQNNDWAPQATDQDHADAGLFAPGDPPQGSSNGIWHRPSNFSQSQAPPAVSKQPENQNGSNRPAEANVNSATGPPYVVYEGTLMETALMNRLDGDSSGPVKVLVTNPVYSHDHEHVLIPEGTVVLGESQKIGSSGFGQQRRLAIAFHRMIMPDGYSVDLDQFRGLNQIGETGLKDKVNNHYMQIFGASIALGIIAGALEASNTGGVVTGSGADAYKYGVASSLSQSATNVLDRFMNIPPAITIREGHRVKVYISQDLLLPAYENHAIPGSF
jgi:type IV secretory pathway VirB10-like protein